jgi:prepilin-type processing-associated H-X9-DG protein
MSRQLISRAPAKLRTSGFTLVELLVVVGIVTLMVTILLPAMSKARDASNKSKCASNLHQIGLAILLYQNDNNQSYPRTILDTSGAPVPNWGTPTEAKVGAPNPFASPTESVNDVTASFFLLIRQEQITSQVFICPDSNAEKWDFGGKSNTAQNWVNWTDISKNLSYSYENPFASNTAIANGWQLKNPDATYAIAADMNPGTSVPNGAVAGGVTGIKPTSTAAEMKTGNSANHSQEGQNVLFGDGHAEWVTNPFCGSGHDNIYTGRFGMESSTAGPFVGGGTCNKASGSSPYDNQDSILLPNANGT